MESQTIDLLALPAELITQIASILEDDDLCTLRSTCRTMSDQVMREFVRRFFTVVEIIVRKRDLDDFVKLSKYTPLSRHIEKIVLNIPFVVSNLATGEVLEAEFSEKLYVLLASGHVKSRLMTAFCHLSSLSSVIIQHCNFFLDDLGNASRLDPSGNVLHSYMIDPDFDDDDIKEDVASRILSVVLFALSQSKHRPRSLELYLDKNLQRLDMHSMLNGPLASSIATTLSELEQLAIRFPLSRIAPKESFEEFLSLLPNLATMSITDSGACDFDQVFGLARASTSGIYAIPIRDFAQFHLRCLNLVGVQSTWNQLLHFVTQYKLKTLGLHCSRLVRRLEGPWEDQAAPPRSDDIDWQRVFQGMAACAPLVHSLENVALESLGESFTDGGSWEYIIDTRILVFGSQRPNETSAAWENSRQGPKLAAWLETIAQNCSYEDRKWP